MALKRVSECAMEFNQSLIKDLTGMPSTNKKQLETAKKALQEVIQKDLTSRQRELIYLYYYQQLNNRQIANYLHLDESTISRTLKRARNKIYKSLHIYFDYIYLRLNEDS
ncbi:MAG: sigma-70 family RNA polymerase sigma factor [Oscillospiraceae bacterium]|nr:sigma-70 family RNA polymerase sigma factor [Ruminococcus sp.]MDE6707294.1 sigma-70 family RNA polymerase sigma factor [Oscillospiraceae bacterium]